LSSPYMIHLLLAAHDYAGALILRALRRPLMEEGYKITVWVAGPAATVLAPAARSWKESDIGQENISRALQSINPDIILTGTSYPNLIERHLWAAAGGRPTLALFDTWYNFRKRLTGPNGEITFQPSRIGVIDQESANELAAKDWLNSCIEIIGQPHFEDLAANFRPITGQRNQRMVILFASEPYKEVINIEEPTGYDQYAIAQMCLPACKDIDLWILPHPNETEDSWPNWISRQSAKGYNVQLASGDRRDFLSRVDGLIGINSGISVEARVLGLPTLILQPDRKRIINPAFDRLPGLTPVTNKAQVKQAVLDYITLVGGGRWQHPPLSFLGSTRKVIDLINRMI